MLYTVASAVANTSHAFWSGLFSTIGVYPSYRVHKSGVVVVTGASTGIGKDAALDLIRKGYTVFAAVRKQSDGDALIAELSANDASRLIPIILDVTNKSHIANAVDVVGRYVRDNGLPFVALVNNAGISGGRMPVELMNEQTMRNVFEVNFFGLFLVTQAFVPLIRKYAGRIINVSSVAGAVAAPLGSTYAATKRAVISLSESLRAELRPFKVSVSTVLPGAIRTPIFDKSVDGIQDLASHLGPYAPVLVNQSKFFNNSVAKAPLPSVSTTPAILHAVTAKFPRPKYFVGADAVRIGFLVRMLPERLKDFIIAFIFGWK